MFGIQNIFKLHESTLATKMAVSTPNLSFWIVFNMSPCLKLQIEKATLVELDWALTHLGGGKAKKQTKSSSEDWIVEMDVKGNKEDVCSPRISLLSRS